MGNSTTISFQCYDSPCGRLLLGMTPGHLCLCYWMSSCHLQYWEHRMRALFRETDRLQTEVVPGGIVEQLDDYFGGKRLCFDVPTLCMGTDFQQLVWQTVSEIPYGHTISYKEVAVRVGRPGAIRAVAHAVAMNPLQLIVPCHRVLGADGGLTGYAGGMTAKRFLLDLEQGCRL